MVIAHYLASMKILILAAMKQNILTDLKVICKPYTHPTS